jgi:hypothetical protein
MEASRRDLFKLAAGVAAGSAFTPMPWRLITDTAILSQNWPGVPVPRRGEPGERFTNCALCTAGCPVRARCVDKRPVSLAGLAKSPLCALGLAGHHMPFHAGRLVNGEAERVEEVIRRSRGAVAVLDLRPGRTASWTYRRAMAAMPNGIYLAPQRLLSAVNLKAARTVVSFGVPVLDGWGTPGNVLAAREHFRLIQVEPEESHTAMLADRWIPIRPGAQAAAALEIARELPSDGTTLVLSATELPAVLNLNAALGSLGRTVIARAETPAPSAWTREAAPVTTIQDVPDHSIGALLIDESSPDIAIPWDAIAPKLSGDGVVVTFASSSAGYGRYAQFVQPVAVYPEITSDIPPAIDSVVATFRLATPLLPAPGGVVDPASFIAHLAGVDASEALRERADAIHSNGRGSLLTYADRQSRPVKEMKAAEFWTALNAGGCWVDSERPAATPLWDLNAAAPALCEAVRPRPPLFTKLCQESGLKGVA